MQKHNIVFVGQISDGRYKFKTSYGAYYFATKEQIEQMLSDVKEYKKKVDWQSGNAADC